MKKNFYVFSFLLAAGFLFIVSCGGAASDSEEGGDTDIGTFTNGDETLSANTTESGGTKTTVITDDDGTEILTMELTVDGVSFSFPGYDDTTDITFSAALDAMPTDYSANLLATYVAGQLRSEGAMSVNPELLGRSPCRDNPGCDWFPDTACTLGCCADHDACYALNDCGASSWIPFVGSDACKDCNAVAAACIELSCAGAIDTFTEDNCYDARCGERYDCEDGTCDCTSPCEGTSVTACTTTSYESCCGNGSCEVTEDEDNCYSDCSLGDGTNTCCVGSNDCPTEGAYTCADSPTCCCCGYGEVCDQSGTHLCVASSRGDDLSIGTKTLRW